MRGTPDADTEKPDAAVVRDALGVGIAVGLSGFAFGVTAAGSGLTLLQTCALSLLVFTGASQFALVGALAAGGNPYTAAAGAFFLGVRNAFYGLRLSQLLALPRALRPLAAQWVIDETTAVTLPQPTRRAARIGFTVTGLTLYTLWNLTTLLGAFGAEALGDTDAWGLDAASPAVFLALLAPMLSSATERVTAGLAVLLVLGLLPVLPAGAPVLMSALAAPVVLVLKGRRAQARTRDDGDGRGATGGPDEHAAGGPAPEEPPPGGSTPGRVLPADATPGHPTPGERGPGDAAPGDGTPSGDATRGGSTSAGPTPGEGR